MDRMKLFGMIVQRVSSIGMAFGVSYHVVMSDSIQRRRRSKTEGQAAESPLYSIQRSQIRTPRYATKSPFPPLFILLSPVLSPLTHPLNQHSFHHRPCLCLCFGFFEQII